MICFVYIFFTAWFKFHWAEGDRTPLVICCTIMALLCWALPPRHWDNSSHFTMIDQQLQGGRGFPGWMRAQGWPEGGRGKARRPGGLAGVQTPLAMHRCTAPAPHMFSFSHLMLVTPGQCCRAAVHYLSLHLYVRPYFQKQTSWQTLYSSVFIRMKLNQYGPVCPVILFEWCARAR